MTITGIVETVDESMFRAAFERMGRGNHFSPEGRVTLFDYLNELSDDLGEPIELDVVALCCEFAEYTVAEFLTAYPHCKTDIEEELGESVADVNPDDLIVEVGEWAHEHTSAISFRRHNSETGEEFHSLIVGTF